MEIIKATLVLWILVPRNFWLFLIADIFLSFGYGIVVFSLFAYIQNTFGDPGIKIYNFMWIGMMPLLTILLAPFCDVAGLRKTLIYGTSFIVLGTFLTPLFNNTFVVLLLGLIPLVIGKAVLNPVFNIGIKRYTNKNNITVAFGLFSILTTLSMSAGSFFYSYFEDIFNIKNSGGLFFGHFSIFQILTFASFIFSVPALLAGFFIHEESNADKKILLNFQKVAGDMKNIFASVIKSRVFWIFIFVIGSLVFVRI
jgi:MFS family permease